MNSVTATIETTDYNTLILSPAGNTIIADEPDEAGGQNAGFTPSELLNAALAACTDITLRMYARRKKWDLATVKTTVSYTHDTITNTTAIKREIILTGNLTEDQRQRLMLIANRCPLHEVLNNPISIDTIAG
jgi:putative redox protein